MDAIGPPPTAAPTAAPVPAPTSSDCEAHPEMPISAARTATAMFDLIICFSVVNENATETITAAILATVGVQLLPIVTARPRATLPRIRRPTCGALPLRGTRDGNQAGGSAMDSPFPETCNGERNATKTLVGPRRSWHNRGPPRRERGIDR